MDGPFPGFGTVLNVVTVLGGSALGLAAGHRLPARGAAAVTQALGLVTLLVAGLSAMAVTQPALEVAVGPGVPLLIVLASLVLGAVAGSWLHLERRLQTTADAVAGRVSGAPGARERVLDGWLTATLLFCVGPLTVLGALSDGMGAGIEQLVLKSTLDGLAAIALAASLGIGVLLSAVSVLVVQGLLTVAGWFAGALLPEAHVAALTATGGLVLAAVALRLLRIGEARPADLLPALLAAPVLTQAVVVLR